MRSRAALFILVILPAAAHVVACTTAIEEEATPAATTTAAVGYDPNKAPATGITDAAALRALESKGFGFGHHFGVADGANGATLAGTPAWSSIAAGIDANLDTLMANDAAACKVATGASCKTLDVGMRYNHRLFDRTWLRSSRSKFTLAAVTNRLDRATSATGDCGEVRFIYRLEYDDPREKAFSRMPMTVAVVLPQQPRTGEVGCQSVARRWQALSGSGAQLATIAASSSGPLSSLPAVTSFETNLQAVRWPSGAREDMGGHGEYMLNVWKPKPSDPGSFAAALLENTPDFTAVDATKKSALVKWIKAHANAIDRGSAKLPDEFLARTAYSYGPRGLARRANRPYSAILSAADLADVPFAGMKLVKSPEGMLRRLDEQSCQGCHQSRGMAGFHMLGNEDDVSTPERMNRLAVGTSPHYNEINQWRARLVKAVADGESASEPTAPRPFAEHANNEGLVGQSCGLTADASFASWTCRTGVAGAPDLACKDLIGDGLVGTCQPKDHPRAGDACQTDTMSASLDPHADKVKNVNAGSGVCSKWKSGGDCNKAAGGFPGGACTASCGIDRNGVPVKVGALIEGEVDAICGIGVAEDFNVCMGEQGANAPTFESCVRNDKNALIPSIRKACNVELPCRDDYVCAHLPNAPAGYGACMPPYFIFQARIDGHL